MSLPSPTNLERLPAVAPMERLALSAALDGHAGTNRATAGPKLIAADRDIEAVGAWLARFADVRSTFESYRREAERLLLWAVVERGKALSSLTHEDLLLYERFLADPQPRERWVIAAARRKPARGDPHWRPFAGPLSAPSRRQTMIILNGLFAWLVQAGYLAGNPLALARERRRQRAPYVTRYLDAGLWAEVRATIEALPKQTARERAHYQRVRWLFSLLYGCGLRISEVAANRMGGFFCRHDSEGVERWWIEVHGKGAKTRLVPATAEIMGELACYRRSRGLPALPAPGEGVPLLLPLGGQPRAMTRAALHTIIKEVFRRVAARLRAQGEEHAGRARRIEQASAHWLRHTAGSHMADRAIDLHLIRETLGHTSLGTTSQYVHANDDRRHRETEAKHRLGW